MGNKAGRTLQAANGDILTPSRQKTRTSSMGNKAGRTLQAAANGDLPRLKILIDQKADVNTKNKYGNTPLTLGSCGHLEIVKYLVGVKANIEAKNNDGNTPLTLGSCYGHLEIVKYLVGVKANIEAKNNDGNTPLILGSWNGHLETVKYLVGIKANIEAKTKNGHTPLTLGSAMGHLETVKYLVDMKANIEAKTKNGDTPLTLSSWKGHLEIVKYLVGMKANIEAQPSHGNTPLILGSKEGHLEIVKYLVGAKANIEAKNIIGDTPLTLSSWKGHLETVKYLVGAKANIEAKNNEGQTALYRAKKQGHNDIVDFLRNDEEIQKIRDEVEKARQEAEEAGGRRKEALRFGKVQIFTPDEIKQTGDLGEGQFGKVFQVEITIDKKETVAAMKRIGNQTDLSQALLSELLILSKLKSHPNLLLFYGVVTIEGRLHFLNEFCAKGSLDALHKKEDLISKDRFWQIVGGVLSGLAAFHQSGLVHRDIACRNLFMKANGVVVLGDYGLSKKTKGKNNIYTMTTETMLPWAWCAPESLLQREFSQKSDIWMFGVTVWEILTKGKSPSKELSSLQLFRNELQKGRMPLKIPDGPPRSKQLLSLCFQFEVKNPTQKKRTSGKPMISWTKHDVVNFIKTISTSGNKNWAKCIEVVLEHDLEYSVLEDCEVEHLVKLGIPELYANSLLRKLQKVYKEGVSGDAKEPGDKHGKIMVDATVRPSASALIQKFAGWSKEDDCEYINEAHEGCCSDNEDDYKHMNEAYEGCCPDT